MAMMACLAKLLELDMFVAEWFDLLAEY